MTTKCPAVCFFPNPTTLSSLSLSFAFVPCSPRFISTNSFNWYRVIDDDYDYDDDYYDDDDGYGYDDYVAKPAAVAPKKPANNAKANNTKTINANNNNNNANNKNVNANTNNKNANTNTNNNNKKNNSTAPAAATAQPLLTPGSLTPNQSTISTNSKLTSSQELCPISWIQEKNKGLAQLWQDQARPTQLSTHMLMIGHVDSGKSSLLGRLLLTQGRVNNRTLEGLQKEATQIGKGSFALAWLSDEQVTERTRGVTVDVVAKWFLTPHRTVYVWDCPGHRDFVGNMLSAANHAKSAILLVSARTGEFESGIGYHLQSAPTPVDTNDKNKTQSGQTREHALLAFGSGVRNIIVAVNKMDEVGYDPQRYLFICTETRKMLGQIGFDVSPGSPHVRYVPVSAMTGVNIASTAQAGAKGDESPSTLPAELAAWYTNAPSLIDLIDTLPSDNGSSGLDREEFNPIPTTGPNPDPFAVAVHETFVSPLFGLSVHGKVLSGSCMVKEKVVLFPSGLVAKVKGIEHKNELVEGCFQGDVVTLQVALLNSNEDVQNTMSTALLCDPYPPQFGKRFIAHIHTSMTLNGIPLIPGANLVIHSQHLHSIGTITKIIHSQSLLDGPDDEHPEHVTEDEVIKGSEVAKQQKQVVKRRMITNQSISVVEITLQVPLPFVNLNKFKAAVGVAQKMKDDHEAVQQDQVGLNAGFKKTLLSLDQYKGPIDRICIRRGNETVATGVAIDVLEEERYDFVV